MPKLIITCGLSGSGKSTYAESLAKTGFAEINRDKVRFNFYTNGVKDWGLYKFTKAREEHVSQVCTGDWETWSSFGYDIIVSDTNLDKKYHNTWRLRAEQAGYDFEIKYFDITLEEAYKRDLRRGGQAVGRDVLNKQWKQWLKITGRKTYNPSGKDFMTKTSVILVDVDGTVARMGDRSPFDWAKVALDTPRQEIISLIKASSKGRAVIFLSGRDASCFEETNKWLLEHFGSFHGLCMRPVGDQRRDSIIKEELFWILVSSYHIEMVFDDRPQVVLMWKDLGLTVIDVSEGYDEF